MAAASSSASQARLTPTEDPRFTGLIKTGQPSSASTLAASSAGEGTSPR